MIHPAGKDFVARWPYLGTATASSAPTFYVNGVASGATVTFAVLSTYAEARVSSASFAEGNEIDFHGGTLTTGGIARPLVSGVQQVVAAAYTAAQATQDQTDLLAAGTTNRALVIAAIPAAAANATAVWADSAATNVKNWSTRGLTMIQVQTGSIYQLTEDSLELAPAGGGGGGGFTQDDRDTLNGVATSLLAAQITVISRVARTGNVTIYQGDDHAEAVGTALLFTIPDYTGPAIDTITYAMQESTKCGLVNNGNRLQVTGEVAMNGDDLEIMVEIPHADSDTLTNFNPWAYSYQLLGVSDGEERTLKTGQATVVQRVAS